VLRIRDGKATDLLLMPAAVAAQTGQHQIITLLRQELGPIPDKPQLYTV
jgi:hypothetical protein